MTKILRLIGLFLAVSYFETSIAQTVVINEVFNGTSLPAQWSIETEATDGGWKVGTAAANSSTAWTIPAFSGNLIATNDDACNCDKSNDVLITPTLDLSTVSNAFLSLDYFFFGETYQGNTETAKLRVSTNGGSTWSDILDFTGAEEWTNLIVNLNSYVGQSDVKLSIVYNDGSGWLYGFALDNFKVYEALNLDLSGVSVNLPEYALNNAPLSISGVLKNLGANAITNLTINYTINNGAAVSAPINGINITPTANYNFTHPTNWTPSAEGTYTIKVWASGLNGNADQNNANDTITTNIYIANQLAQRTVLFEQFTSNTCGPCASVAPTVANLLANNNVNQANGKVASIKYHQNFPQPGTDAAYTAESNARRGYYGISGIPGAVVSGNAFNGHPVNLNQTIIDQVYNKPTIFSINVDASYNGNTVTVNADLTSFIAFAGSNTRFHIAIIEKSINNLPGGTTSQVVFTHVSRKMLPNQTGSAVGNMTVNQTQSFNFTHTLPNVFSTMDGLTVVAFVQNNTTLEVYQAAVADITTSVNNLDAFKTNIYPNPATDLVYINLENPANERVLVNVFNMHGQMVRTQDFGRLGADNQLIEFNNSDLMNGIYFYQIIVGEKMVTRKISIAK